MHSTPQPLAPVVARDANSHDASKPIDREARILILGAGPGGLSAAHFLRKYGYRNVTVFEKLDRVGGMCRTVMSRGHVHDLAAVLVCPDFHEVLEIAREVGAKLEKFRGMTGFVFDEATQSADACSLLHSIAGGSTWRNWFRLTRRLLRYAYLRFRIGRLFRGPGWEAISAHPELHVSFGEWLRTHRLEDLRRAFEIPITAFGYGSLEEIAAPYALKYATIRGFISLLLAATPCAGLLPRWLAIQYFSHGYQHLWERLSSDLDVRLRVDVRRVRRHHDALEVEYGTSAELADTDAAPTERRAQFDYLIVAHPFRMAELSRIFDLDPEERYLEERCRFNPNVTVQFEVADLKLPGQLAIRVPPSPVGHVLGFFQEDRESPTISALIRLPDKQLTAQQESDIRREIERYVHALGGRIVGSTEWPTFDVWTYFKHVDVEAFRAGYFERWDRLQGRRRTFYTGGLFDFDHVEGAVRASRRLVERFFAKVT